MSSLETSRQLQERRQQVYQKGDEEHYGSNYEDLPGIIVEGCEIGVVLACVSNCCNTEP